MSEWCFSFSFFWAYSIEHIRLLFISERNKINLHHYNSKQLAPENQFCPKMGRPFLISTCLTLIYFSLFMMANADSTCLEDYAGIYLTRNENRVAHLAWFSSDGTLITIDSNQKVGSPTVQGRNDRIGRWKCRDSETPDIFTQSVQMEESKNPTDPLAARLYETETTCSNNKRTSCRDIIQYRHLNITISTDPPEQIYSFASNFSSSNGRSLFLPYKLYAYGARRHSSCLSEKSGMYMIEYQTESGNGEVKKTYGLFLLKNDGFFSLINSNEREDGTHKFGTTLGRWRCTHNTLFATGIRFIYHPQQKLGEVRLHIRGCSPSITRACTGYVESQQYPLQLRQRPFRRGSPKIRENITMIEYMSAPQTKGKRCFKDFAGTYFSLLGSVNDTTGGTLLSGAYRTLQLYSDGRAYGCQTAEILTKQALGNIVGHWTCNETSSDSTHIAIRRIHLFYDTR